MDFVYICRNGENEELRYSIRSVVQNAPVSNVWVVGGRPDWYRGNFLHVKDSMGKYDNIRNALFAACESPDISEDFVLMNDDFFIVRKLESVSVYHGGLLKERALAHQAAAGRNQYANLLARTDKALRQIGIEDPVNYDLHVPMPINKTKMLKYADLNYSMMSYYGNAENIGGEEIRDVKIYSTSYFLDGSYNMDEDLPYMSTEDGSFKEMQHSIHNMFYMPSDYE